jgi:ribosome-binding factor A
MRAFKRTDRVGDLIQKELAIILQAKFRDGDLPMITVSAVQLARDLAYAKIYVSTLGAEAEIKAVVKTLNIMAPKLRYLLAQTIRIRTTPELQFVYDSSIVEGSKLSALIDSVDPDKKD